VSSHVEILKNVVGGKKKETGFYNSRENYTKSFSTQNDINNKTRENVRAFII
jgi:hypothetical protein